MCMHASALAGLRVPVVPVLCVPVCLGGGCGSEWMDPARCVHTCCRSPRNFISQDWIRPGLAKVQGVREWQTNKQRSNVRSRSRGRVSVWCRGLLSPSVPLSLSGTASQYAHKSLPTHYSLALGVQVVQDDCPIR